MSRYDRYRQMVNQYLDQAEGAHYLHGSFGNHPGFSNGHPVWYHRLSMPEDRYGDTPTRNPQPPRIHSAVCASDVTTFCCGRPRTATALPCVPRNIAESPAALRHFALTNRPETYRWPRPDTENPGQLTFGESCQNKRHFDCIGLVNWVMWSIFLTTSINSIAHCQRHALAQAASHPDIAATIQTGDILIFNLSHIGIAIDATHMMEAKGAHWGVTRSNIGRSRVTAKLRPTDEILLGRWNVRG
ncbi:hypothetical protein F183_A38240 [Bryobacterales bacterium F-183]|nr:hypothetical protein F183_A38240 [Bryobacterales bacterium F-183]